MELELADYLDMFTDMRNDAAYYLNLGIEHDLTSLVENAQLAINTADAALQAATNEDAPTWYNEIRGALRFCEDISEEAGL